MLVAVVVVLLLLLLLLQLLLTALPGPEGRLALPPSRRRRGRAARLQGDDRK